MVFCWCYVYSWVSVEQKCLYQTSNSVTQKITYMAVANHFSESADNIAVSFCKSKIIFHIQPNHTPARVPAFTFWKSRNERYLQLQFCSQTWNKVEENVSVSSNKPPHHTASTQAHTFKSPSFFFFFSKSWDASVVMLWFIYTSSGPTHLPFVRGCSSLASIVMLMQSFVQWFELILNSNKSVNQACSQEYLWDG